MRASGREKTDKRRMEGIGLGDDQVEVESATGVRTVGRAADLATKFEQVLVINCLQADSRVGDLQNKNNKECMAANRVKERERKKKRDLAAGDDFLELPLKSLLGNVRHSKSQNTPSPPSNNNCSCSTMHETKESCTK